LIRRRAAAGLFLTVLLAACSAPIGAPTPNDAVVYLIRREWHTDLGLPVEEIAAPLTALEKPFPGVRFLTFGFGERQFLLDRKKDFGAMLAAILPSQSALLVTALASSPEQAFGQRNVITLHVPRVGLDKIEGRIAGEFELSTADEPVRLADGPYPGSLFYAARHTYSGLYTCNTWTAEVLRTGGLAIPTTGVLFADQVMSAATWIGTHQALLPGVIAKTEVKRPPR
jgi:hypothetical protein